ncbi:MAG: trimeric intracellular cation channel family protein [Acidobacteria bacterium]|nr:trimeric intracellular cation channel family protein [Acidobacteriota bacterium]MBS1866409.1 trimeric intracellular cation channel family protein [Acidobacteriota bacterium]
MLGNERIFVSDFLKVLDLVGTFAFAISGATAGVKHKLDIFGVLVLSFAAATSGGIARDVLIGAVPPAALYDWRYMAVSLLAGLVTFFWSPLMDRLRSPVQLFDAAGLALFAVVGAGKALTFHLQPFAAVMLGILTGIGGGMVRDMLLSEIPVVFTAELYAVAALAGALVVVIGNALQLANAVTASIAMILCFGLRMMAIKRGWKLPVARQPD